MTELILFTKGGEDSKGKGAKWYVRYEAEKTLTPGQTKVVWELYKGGRTDTPTYLATTIEFYIDGEKVYAPERFSTEPNSKGTNHPHCSYAANKNTTPTTKGEFIVSHGPDGNGSFTMQVKAAIYTQTLASGEEQTIELEKNYPQTPCYWASGAKVKIEQPYVAPEGKFTISWSGAVSGVDNKIAGYNVYYKVGTNEFTHINSGGLVAAGISSLDAYLPSNALRGASITAKVEIIGEKIETPVPAQSNSSSKVNPKLGNLQIVAYTGQETNNTFSYKAQDIEFAYILPTKATPQQIVSKVKIDNGDEATLQDNPYVYDLTNSVWDYDETKTFVFWATDGVEDSNRVEIKLRRNVNIENQVSYVIEGYGFKITIPDGYTAKLKTSQSMALTNGVEIDFRSLCTDLQSGKAFKQTAYLEYTNGGPDTITEEITLAGEVPAFTMSGTVQGLEQYFVGNDFGTLEINNIPSDSAEQWSCFGVKEVGPGKTLEQVKMKGSIGDEFYVAVDQDNIVTAIKNLNLNLKLEGGGPYKPYSSTPIFSSVIESNNWGQYGLNGAPTLTFWFKGSSENASASSLGASSDNTIAYQLAGEAVYNIVPSSFNTGDKGRLSYSYTNVYGTEVTQTSEALFEFDFREQAKRVDSDSAWYICAIPSGKNWDTNYAIENWDCIKENMPLSTNFEVAATTQPIAWLERKINNSWQKFYDFNVIETGNKDEETFNAPVSIYKLQPVANDGKVGKITDGTAGPIRLVVKTDSPDNLAVGYANNSSFSFAYHVPPLIKFTDVSYEAPQLEGESGKITAKYEILSLGSDSKFNPAKTYECKIENEEGLISQSSIDEGAQEVSFSYTINGTFVNIAPVLITTLSATLTTSNEQAFKTEYSTLEKDYVYIVCYNISPTVAYRANYLGINTNVPVEDALLDINAHNNHQLIYLRGTNHLSTVDLTTGALINFVLDAGSWDGTPGGVIPSNPEVPTGLATIAYTGEFGDLLQRRKEVIIISGGTASEI